MSASQHGVDTGTPKGYRLPLNISLPYIYNWNSYDGLPASTTDRLTWNSFPAGEPTSFLISAVSRAEINQPSPINGQPVARPADIEGNPVEIGVYSSKESSLPFDVAVSLVPQDTGPTPHVHWSDNEWFYVLSGSITLYVDHSLVPDYAIPGVDGTALADHLYEIKLDAGQMIYGPSNMIHSFTNYSNEPATWLTIWQREQNEQEGGISQFFTRGDIAPLVLDYEASLDYYQNSDFTERVAHWAKTFPLYNVTIAKNFGSYISSGAYDPNHPNQPGKNNPNVIKGAPQAVLDANNALILSSLFQSFDDLQTSISNNQRTTSIRSAGGKIGLPINLEVAIDSGRADDSIYGYFHVDNRRGDIDGVKPGGTSYLEKAQRRLRPLYSQPPSLNSGLGEGSKTIAVETGDTLGFFKRSRQGNTTLSTTQPHSFNLVNGVGSYQPPDGITVNTRLKGAIADLNTIISGHNKDYHQPLLDTSPLEKRKSAIYSKFKVTSQGSRPYSAGYYKVLNAAGDVISADNEIVSPGDPGYKAAALSERNAAIELNTIVTSALERDGTATGTFRPGHLYAPFVTASRTTGGKTTYFAYKKANTSNATHIVSTGSNTFGFRGSKWSKEFDDLRIAASFSLDQEESDHACHKHADQIIEIQNHGLSTGSLVFYRVDPLTGGVNGMLPGEKGYLRAAYAWGKKNDTIIKKDQLPDLYSSISYQDIGISPDYTYGMVYVRRKDKQAVDLLSSYAAANQGGRQSFAAYGSENCVHTYGLETRGSDLSKVAAAFNDLVITSTVDNITVWA
jgi:mannose-6-phosphate isomerase-like protein (cupin superfamily)